MSREICKEKKLCTGCTACASICPKNCIDMKPDAEGFLYPQINEELCIDCQLCVKTCPVNNPIKPNKVIRGYVARNKSIEIVDNSTSGGTCSAFADYTFAHNGILYGVGYDKNMTVQHLALEANERNKISEIRGSKYVQSYLGDSLKKIKHNLDFGKFVCFTGTPCQVAGLKAFLKKDYENLLTIDLVCRGVSSPMVFNRYIKSMEKNYGARVKDVRFRNKTYGYHSATMMVTFDNGKKYYGSGRVDYMSKAYYKGACSRMSCYQCPFKSIEHNSDLMVFESWNVEKLEKKIKDDDRGFTNILVYSQKGENVLQKIGEYMDLWPANPDKMVELDGVMLWKQPLKAAFRDDLLISLQTEDFEKSMQKFLPVSRIDKILEGSKRIFYKIGILRYVK